MSGSEHDGVWVKTEPSVDGKAYVVTLEVDDDTAITFDRTRATNYALAVLDAAHRAAYDAAIFGQLTRKLGIGEQDAAHLVVDVRDDRPPIAGETGPLELVPGVSGLTRKPFLAVKINGKQVGQWTVDAAREHARSVLECVVVADLDAGYYRALTGLVGAAEPQARQAVEDIANYREDGS